jgi:hypothetical protein
MFLENLIKLSCFIDDKNYKVIKKHQYGVGEKTIFPFKHGMREKNDKKCTFIWHLHNK